MGERGDVDAQAAVSLLFAWGRQNRRSFPWRETEDLYQLLISEILLRRSRSSDVASLLPEFFTRWPDLDALASADREEIASLIRPLGLVRRSVHLVELAQQAARSGGLPSDAEDLERLPGVGPYAARSTAGLPVVDAVSARVYRRCFGMLDTDSHREVDDDLWRLVEDVTPHRYARELNWAVLDLAAAVCLPRRPDCARCPVYEHCVFAAETDRP